MKISKKLTNPFLFRSSHWLQIHVHCFDLIYTPITVTDTSDITEEDEAKIKLLFFRIHASRLNEIPPLIKF